MASKDPGRFTWSVREQPILEEIWATEESDRDRIWSEDLARTLGLPGPDVTRALRALMDAEYITASDQLGGNGSIILLRPRLLERGRRAVGQWPADAFDAFVSALQQRIDEEQEPEARSRLKQLLAAVMGIGRDVAADVIAAAIKRAGGL